MTAATAPTVDAHQHFLDPTRYAYPWIDADMTPLHQPHLPEDLAVALSKAGVRQTVTVQARQTLEETQWLLALADAHPWIAGVVGWVDLTDPALDAVLDGFADRPRLVGIRHVTHDEPDPDWLMRDDVCRGLGVLERRGYTFDLLLRPMHLRHVPALAERFPGLPMVIDHLAKPAIASGRLDGWREDFAAAARYPNVFCKLSGMITEADPKRWTAADLAPYVAEAVAAFGFERLMFGSDWPVCRLAGAYEQVVTALREALGPISSHEQAQLFGDTARRFYQLPD
ncbi:MAG: amidohydrolase family protein [Phycisphaeraceae bacterium]